MVWQRRWVCGIFSGGVVLAAVVACGSTTSNSENGTGAEGAGGGASAASNGSGSSTVNGASTNGMTASAVTGAGGTAIVTHCPTFEPSPGSACDPDGVVCSFPNCSGPDFRDSHELTCVMGAWTVNTTDLCNVPVCPEGYVYLGGPCDTARMPESCPVTDACGVTIEFVCVDDVWQSNDDGADPVPGAAGADGAAPSMDTTTGGSDVAPLACPAEAPYDGAPCCPERLPETCDYTSSTTTGVFIVLPPDEGMPLQPLSCGRCNDLMMWEPCEIK